MPLYRVYFYGLYSDRIQIKSGFTTRAAALTWVQNYALEHHLDNTHAWVERYTMPAPAERVS